MEVRSFKIESYLKSYSFIYSKIVFASDFTFLIFCDSISSIGYISDNSSFSSEWCKSENSFKN